MGTFTILLLVLALVLETTANDSGTFENDSVELIAVETPLGTTTEDRRADKVEHSGDSVSINDIAILGSLGYVNNDTKDTVFIKRRQTKSVNEVDLKVTVEKQKANRSIVSPNANNQQPDDPEPDCYSCTDCFTVNIKTPTKSCLSSEDTRCVVFTKTIHNPETTTWQTVTRGCLAEIGTCEDIINNNLAPYTGVVAITCRECSENLCNEANKHWIPITIIYLVLLTIF